MKRLTFDKIVTAVGFGLTGLLLVTAGLLNWGSNFASDAVSSQLIAQEIAMPTETGNPDEYADVTEFFAKNGGAMLMNSEQSQMYADNYLGFHLSKMPTYAAASNNSRTAAAALAADPGNAVLISDAASKSGTVETVFKGTMLRGTLLTAYAFGTLGSIAAIAALVSLGGAIVMFLLSLLGLLHIRRTPLDATI